MRALSSVLFRMPLWLVAAALPWGLGGCDARGSETAAPGGPPPPPPAADGGTVVGAQLCCAGDVQAGLGGCLGDAHLVGRIDGANQCVAAGHRLLACAPEAGGWSCLPPRDGTPQLCTCGAPSESLSTGVDPHTWSRRAEAVYAAHQAPRSEALPRPLCCDEVDAASGTCTWSYEVPSALRRKRTTDVDSHGDGKRGKKAGDEPEASSGSGSISVSLPPGGALEVPPRGPIRDGDRGRCKQTGGEILECPARATACAPPRRTMTAEGTTYGGSCTCESAAE